MTEITEMLNETAQFQTRQTWCVYSILLQEKVILFRMHKTEGKPEFIILLLF